MFIYFASNAVGPGLVVIILHAETVGAISPILAAGPELLILKALLFAA